MTRMIPHNKPTLGTEEQRAVARVLASGWVAQGAEVEAFEADLCKFFGLPDGHSVTVSSGSAALYLALWVLGGKNERIGVPVYSCAALRNAVGMIGRTSVFLDCAEGSPNLDVAQAEQAGLDILIAPSMFGIPIDLPEKSSFRVIEDLAQALGAEINGQRIGLRGEVGICSFYATKMITSGGQGGAVISRNKTLIDNIRDYREFDCRDDDRLRFNFQMTDLQATIGRAQLARLPNFIERRERLFSIYQQAGLDLLEGGGCPVRYRAVYFSSQPRKMIKVLQNEGVAAINPLEEYELLDMQKKFPIAKDLTHKTVSLPIYPTLSEDNVTKIAKIVNCEN